MDDSISFFLEAKKDLDRAVEQDEREFVISGDLPEAEIELLLEEHETFFRQLETLHVEGGTPNHWVSRLPGTTVVAHAAAKAGSASKAARRRQGSRLTV